jgi:hypothetical protein
MTPPPSAIPGGPLDAVDGTDLEKGSHASRMACVGRSGRCGHVRATPPLERLLEPPDVERIWSRHWS